MKKEKWKERAKKEKGQVINKKERKSERQMKEKERGLKGRKGECACV